MNTGKRLERLVAAIHHAESRGGTVVWDDEIEGRQFDVSIRFKFGLHSYLTVVECKDYSSKVNVEKLDAFVTKSRDAKANKAVFISSRGFQSGCFAVAERHGIQLLVLTETSEVPVLDLVERFIPGLNIYRVRVSRADSGKQFELEDWGGRLSYLMNHSKLTAEAWERTPTQLVNEWQLSSPRLDLKNENEVEIPLPRNAHFQEPHEVPIPVNKFHFVCSFVELAIPKSPMPDNHIWQGINTRVELRDQKGDLRHASRLGDLPLSFDAPVEQGKFYEVPAIFSRYFCDKIEGGLVTWTLVESYQHGQLIQATFTQKVKYASTYLQVTDAVLLRRLEAMLSRLRTRHPS